MSKTNLEVAKEFADWLQADESMNGCRGLSNLERDQMFDAWSAATSRICSEKDAEIVELNDALNEDWGADVQQSNLRAKKQLSEKNVLIAMQAEALEAAKNGIKWYIENSDEANGCDDEALEQIDAAISASAESVAAWEDGKLLPLQRQVAMLAKKYRECAYYIGEEGYPTYLEECDAILSSLQATAEAFLNEHAAKVLEEVAACLDEDNDSAYAAIILRLKAAELRAANKGKE